MAKSLFPPSTAAALAANTQAGIAAGVAPGSVPISSSVASAPQTLLYQRITVGAGQRYPVVVSGNLVYCEGIVMSGSALVANGAFSNVSIKPDTANALVYLLEPKRRICFPEQFASLEIYNANTVDIIVYLWAGSGEVQADFAPRIVTAGAEYTNLGGAVAYAANDVVTPMMNFVNGASPFNQRGVITDAYLFMESVNAGADMSLWLFADSAIGVVGAGPRTPFLFPAASMAVNDPDFIGIIRVPAFVTGGAGSTGKICAVSGLGVQVFGQGILNGTIYGCLVANAAYTPVALERYSVNLTVSWNR
jgi:hypothetical protein